MPGRRRPSPAVCASLLACALVLVPHAGLTQAAPPKTQRVDRATWVDHDAVPGPKPAKREATQLSTAIRESVVDPLSHAFDIPDKFLWIARRLGADTERQAVNVNAFDEVPNSTWFTNRNHVRALSLAEVRRGAYGGVRPQPPYTVTTLKDEGITPGFEMKDAAGHTWVVKLDPLGHPRLASGADVVASRLLYAAGYNVPHDEAITFERGDLVIEPPRAAAAQAGRKPLGDAKPDPPIEPAQIDTLLERGARDAQGRWTANASLFLPGKRIGHIDMRGRRRDDPNDWYAHRNRRELRGLYVLMAWLNSWDTKDEQSFEGFMATAGDHGHVKHHLLDFAGSLGAEAEGAKDPYKGYEYTVDWGVVATRLVTLGLVPHRWQRAHQETGMPSVGNMESAVWHPAHFKPMQPHPAFHERTDADGYWGAKLVASFSDAQIRAAVQAAGYDDPRAEAFLAQQLMERRDRTARYWFGRVAPLDFFAVEDGVLNFHDLAVDRGLAGPRSYTVRARPLDGRGARKRWTTTAPTVALAALPGDSPVELSIAAESRDSQSVKVVLARHAGAWAVARVRHD